MASLSFSGAASTLNFDFVGPPVNFAGNNTAGGNVGVGSGVSYINVSGALTNSGTTVINIANNGQGFNGPIDLITFGNSTVTAGNSGNFNFVLGTIPSRAANNPGTLLYISGNNLVLNYQQSGILWTGAVNANWSAIDMSNNWVVDDNTGLNPTNFLTGDTVKFASTYPPSNTPQFFNVNVGNGTAEVVQPSTVTVSSGALYL